MSNITTIQDESTKTAALNEAMPAFDRLSSEEKEKIVEAAKEEAINLHGLASFNAYTIKKQWPKAFKAMTEYAAKKAQQPELADNEDIIAGILLYSSRAITFDLFDDNDIIINIAGDGKGDWSNTVKYSGIDYHASNYPSRIIAEIEGVKMAFEVLEKKLFPSS